MMNRYGVSVRIHILISTKLLCNQNTSSSSSSQIFALFEINRNNVVHFTLMRTLDPKTYVINLTCKLFFTPPNDTLQCCQNHTSTHNL